MFIPFLREFARLTPAQQKIFLFCLERCPFPQPYTGDLRLIMLGTGYPRKTIAAAFVAIAAQPTLSQLVKYIHSDISRPAPVRLHTGIAADVPLDGDGDGDGDG